MNIVGPLRLRAGVLDDYHDVLTPAALDAIAALAPFDVRRRALMRARMERRARRQRDHERIDFLPADATIGGTSITVREARDGRFDGGVIPDDLQRQWIQGTGPAARPRAGTAESIRNVAYALLSGADGWMFDGEDALGQVDTMSLDNHRNLRLAFERADVFMAAAERVAGEMNAWAREFLSRDIISDWRTQLDFTTRIFRARGLHLDDRHIAHSTGDPLGASLVDLALYVVANHVRLRGEGRSVVLYLPKIQTAEEAALWNDMLDTVEVYLGLPAGTIRVYVLVEQLEASFQLMEIRAALGPHFVGFNTGRWD
ncbi:MAG: malate synthase, partial [Gemmatimonadaceae bacterium]